MPAILFVCTANQFRSPIASACFLKKLSTSGIADTWTISSAGTWITSGLPAHPEAILAASKLGLDLSIHRTQEVNAVLLESSNLIVVMESNHKESLELEFPGTIGRIVLLGQLANVPGGEIPDPAKEKFIDSDNIATLIFTSIQRTFPKLVQFTMLLHDGYSALIP